MSTELTLEAALSSIPKSLRDRLIKRYAELKAKFRKADFEPCGMAAGRFVEVMIRVLQDQLTGDHTPFGENLKPVDQECHALEQLPKSAGHESLRIVIPRALAFMYTLRNKRGVGHEGGDVDANEIDAATSVRIADWCLAELIRESHSLSIEEAQAIVDALAEREVPAVWAVAGKKRVLSGGLTKKEETLLLLYSEPEIAIPIEDLCEWVEYRRLDRYRENVAAQLHQRRLIEFDRDTATLLLSPAGAREVESKILPKLSPDDLP